MGEMFQAMFEMMKENNRCLKKVSIYDCYHNILADIEPEVLGSALNSLEDVFIEGRRHDWKDQVTDILQKLVRVESKLKRMKLRFLNPCNINEVNPELVRQAIEKVGQIW